MSPRMPRRTVVLLLGLILVAGSGLAASAEESDDEAPIAVRVSPAIVEVAHDARGAEHTLRVDNTGSEPLRVVTEVTEFTVTPEGVTEFAGPEPLSAVGWVNVDTSTFDVAPGDRRDVVVTVDVPDDAEPGERYVSVIFAVPPTDTDGNITLTHRVAAKLYIDVPGEQTHHLELGELTAPRLVDSGPAHLGLTVHNRGNVHRRFEEATRLVATSADAEVAFENFTVLGESTRVVEAVWPDPPTVCWCIVEVQTDDGQGNLLLASTRVLMFPLRLTLAIVAAAAGLGLLLAGRRRRQAQRLQRLLAEAHQDGRDATTPRTADLPRAPSTGGSR